VHAVLPAPVFDESDDTMESVVVNASLDDLLHALRAARVAPMEALSDE